MAFTEMKKAVGSVFDNLGNPQQAICKKCKKEFTSYAEASICDNCYEAPKQEQSTTDIWAKTHGYTKTGKRQTFDNYVTDTPERKENLRLARLACEQSFLTLIVNGHCGVGKDHLCTALAREWLLQGSIKSAHSLNAIGLMGEYLKNKELMLECDLLHIRDFGTSEMSEKIIPYFTDILDIRIENELKTIITMNLEVKSEFLKMIKERAEDRIYLSATPIEGKRTLTFKGESWRRR